MKSLTREALMTLNKAAIRVDAAGRRLVSEVGADISIITSFDIESFNQIEGLEILLRKKEEQKIKTQKGIELAAKAGMTRGSYIEYRRNLK